jgi:ABC-type transport system involved in cytochrome c biogenesis permease subunit
MNKLIKERRVGVFGTIVWAVAAISCVYTKYTFVIICSLVYSVWFGSYVNDLGRKGKKEAGLI